MSSTRSNGSDAAKPVRDSAQDGPNLGGFRDLLDLLPVGVFLVDREQRIRSLNPAASRLVGVTPDRAVGQRCNEVLQCSFCGDECATCVARGNGTVQHDFPAEIQRPDGSLRSVLLDAVPLTEGSVAVLVRDVSEAARVREAIRERWNFHGLVCASRSMKEVVGQIREVAPYDSTVLIRGESGTGKELVAHALHAESPRVQHPFVVVNCAAYSETLLESELFGHAKGSFTGADRERRGRFELADGGTVFLDEVGEISPKIQVKLLRVLQEREIERVGESRAHAVNLRILAATHRDLRREVREGRFREDLFYRLNVFGIHLPPLRERKEDIPALVEHTLARLASRTGKRVLGVSEDVMQRLLDHPWPGNVRELENVLESAVVRTRGDVVARVSLGAAPTALEERRPEDRVREALRRTGGCVTRAARLLGVHRTTLWRRMRELNMQRDEFLEG